MLISNITPNVKVNEFYKHKEHEVVSTFFIFFVSSCLLFFIRGNIADKHKNNNKFADKDEAPRGNMVVSPLPQKTKPPTNTKKKGTV